MPIVVSITSNKEYEPVSEGVHSVILADIVDLGVIETGFGPKHKVQFTWLTDEADSEGQTKRLFKRYSLSLHEKATLRKDVRRIRNGKDIDTTKPFDLESLLGAQNEVVVQHNEGNDGKTYANVDSIMPLKSGKKLAIPADFTRKKDRPADGSSNGTAKPAATKTNGRAVAQAVYSRPVTEADPITDEDVAF